MAELTKDLETILEDFPQDKVSRPQGRDIDYIHFASAKDMMSWFLRANMISWSRDMRV